MENKKISWLTWLALLFASAALLVSFIFIGQSKDTTEDFETVLEAYNAAIAQYNEIAESYNQVIEDYNEIADQYNLVIEDYWKWRMEQ